MLKIRFHFDGKCRIHSRYNPREHGRPNDPNCPGCESLYVIHLYTGIAEKKANECDGIEVRQKARIQAATDPADDSRVDEGDLMIQGTAIPESAVEPDADE